MSARNLPTGPAAARPTAARSRACPRHRFQAPSGLGHSRARRGHAQTRTAHHPARERTTTRRRARPARTPSIRPAPCASHTSLSPRPNRPRCPALGGSTPSAPSRPSISARVDALAVVCAAHLVAPGKQRRRVQLARIRARHSARNSGLAPATASMIRPDCPARRGDRRVGVGHQLGDRPHGSTPPCASFGLGIRPPRPRPSRTADRSSAASGLISPGQCRRQGGQNTDAPRQRSVRPRPLSCPPR